MTTRPAMPDDPDAITTHWMRQALAAGAAFDAQAIRDVAVENLGATNAFGRIVRCHLTVEDGGAEAPATVIVKLPTADRGAFRFARWLSLHEREYRYYRRIAPHARLRAPSLLYGDFDDATHRFVLVLEDLRDMEVPVQTIGIEATRARLAIRKIAGLHGQFWNAVDHPSLSGCPDVFRPSAGRFMQIAYLVGLPRVLDAFGRVFSERTRGLAEALGSRIAAHFRNVSAGPDRTFIHGDYRAENMFFGAGATDDFAVIDWQACGPGPGLYDVAYCLGGSVDARVRRQIEREALKEYHDVVRRMGAGNFAFEDCWRRYRQNMLGVLVPLVLACGVVDLNDQRLRDLAEVGLERVLAAIEDLDAGEFLPGGGGFPALGRILTAVSRHAYTAHRHLRRL